MRVGSLKRGEIANKATIKEYSDAEAAARQRAAQVAKTQAQVTKAASGAYTATAGHIQTITRTIVKNVPTYITPAVDRGFPLSSRFVLVLDSAASGNNLPALPNSTASTPDTASPVATSTAAGIIASNYGSCRATSAQLSALQGWLADEAEAAQ